MENWITGKETLSNLSYCREVLDTFTRPVASLPGLEKGLECNGDYLLAVYGHEV